MSSDTGILDISHEFSRKMGARQLPELTADYESSVNGLYIVGDLADAPVIKIALNQGWEVARKIALKSDAKGTDPSILDMAIVGAGPSGIGAALACKEAGLSYLVIERERPFHTIQNFPLHKHIFAEPRHIESRAGLWFGDGLKEDLVERWDHELSAHGLQIEQPREVVDIKKDKHGVFTLFTKREGETTQYRARRVMLCIGRRGGVRRLGCEGEEGGQVAYALANPDEWRGKKIAVVGAGDTAAEALLTLCDHNTVTAIVRGEDFTRVKPENRKRIQQKISEGRIRVLYNSHVRSVEKGQIVVTTKAGANEVVPNDQVFALIGADLPIGFLRRIGVKMEGTWDRKRITWLVCSMVIAYLFYAMKETKQWFPFSPSGWAGFHKAIELHVGSRTLGGGFWGTVIYSLIITTFGIQAARRYPSRHQKIRYASLIGSQWILLFILPEFIVPLFMKAVHASQNLIENSWRFYGVVLPWPLFSYNVDATDGAGHGSAFWLALGVVSSFVVIPIVCVFHGKRFCTWVCGCGGLAETLGDRWRHLAPKSDRALQMESMGTLVLAICAVMSAIIANDTYHFIKLGGLSSVKAFKANYYDLVVDFWLSGAIPVGLYPIFGGKIWCRFWCPLAKYMQFISKYFGRLSIQSNDQCIGCGQCTRYCQVGIDVQHFAQRSKEFSNKETSCIQCGICIEVCPMDVMKFGRRSDKLVILDDSGAPIRR